MIPRAALLLFALLAGACAPARPSGTAAPAHPVAACAVNPRVAWLSPYDRACAVDADCAPQVDRQCASFALSRHAVARASYQAELGFDTVTHTFVASRSSCAVPWIAVRCTQGCCVSRIGDSGAWEP